MIKGTANLDIVLDLPGTSSVVRKHILNKSTSKYKIINRAKSHVTTGKTSFDYMEVLLLINQLAPENIWGLLGKASDI